MRRAPPKSQTSLPHAYLLVLPATIGRDGARPSPRKIRAQLIIGGKSKPLTAWLLLLFLICSLQTLLGPDRRAVSQQMERHLVRTRVAPRRPHTLYISARYEPGATGLRSEMTHPAVVMDNARLHSDRSGSAWLLVLVFAGPKRHRRLFPAASACVVKQEANRPLSRVTFP